MSGGWGGSGDCASASTSVCTSPDPYPAVAHSSCAPPLTLPQALPSGARRACGTPSLPPPSSWPSWHASCRRAPRWPPSLQTCSSAAPAAWRWPSCRRWAERERHDWRQRSAAVSQLLCVCVSSERSTVPSCLLSPPPSQALPILVADSNQAGMEALAAQAGMPLPRLMREYGHCVVARQLFQGR